MPRERVTAAAVLSGSSNGGNGSNGGGSRAGKRTRERGVNGTTTGSSTASTAVPVTIAPVFHPELRRTKEVIRRPEWVRHAGEAVAHRGSLGLWGVFGLLFSNCVGGGYGFEDGIGAAGPLITLIVCVLLPWLWCFPTGLAVAELSTAVPSNSGILMWTNAAFPPFVSFMCIIGTLFITFVGNAIYPNLTAEYVTNLVPLNFAGAAGVKLGVLLLSCVLNVIGVEVVGSSSIVLCAVTLLPFVLVIVIQLFGHGFNKAVLYVDTASVNWASFFSIISWNYANIENAGAVIEEIKNPRRTMPLAMMLLMLSTYMAYVLPMLAGVSAMGVGQDYTQWQAGHWPEVAQQLAGPWLRYLLFCGAILSGTGFTLTSMCCTSRLLAGMGTMQMFPRRLSRLIGYYHPRLGTPITAVVLNTVLTMTFSVALDFAKVVSLCQCLYCLRMLFIYGAVIKLRVEYPRLARPFALPCNTLVAALCLAPAALFSLVAGVASALTSRAISIALVCVVVGGAAVSYVYCRIFARNGFQGVIVQCEVTDDDAVDDDDVSAHSVPPGGGAGAGGGGGGDGSHADETLGEGVFYHDGHSDAPGDMLLGILPLPYANQPSNRSSRADNNNNNDGDDDGDDDGDVDVPTAVTSANAGVMASMHGNESVVVVRHYTAAAMADGNDADDNYSLLDHHHDNHSDDDYAVAGRGLRASNGSYAYAAMTATAGGSSHTAAASRVATPTLLSSRRYVDDYSDAEGAAEGGGGGSSARHATAAPTATTTTTAYYRDAYDRLRRARDDAGGAMLPPPPPLLLLHGLRRRVRGRRTNARAEQHQQPQPRRRRQRGGGGGDDEGSGESSDSDSDSGSDDSSGSGSDNAVAAAAAASAHSHRGPRYDEHDNNADHNDDDDADVLRARFAERASRTAAAATTRSAMYNMGSSVYDQQHHQHHQHHHHNSNSISIISVSGSGAAVTRASTTASLCVSPSPPRAVMYGKTAATTSTTANALPRLPPLSATPLAFAPDDHNGGSLALPRRTSGVGPPVRYDGDTSDDSDRDDEHTDAAAAQTMTTSSSAAAATTIRAQQHHDGSGGDAALARPSSTTTATTTKPSTASSHATSTTTTAALSHAASVSVAPHGHQRSDAYSAAGVAATDDATGAVDNDDNDDASVGVVADLYRVDGSNNNNSDNNNSASVVTSGRRDHVTAARDAAVHTRDNNDDDDDVEHAM